MKLAIISHPDCGLHDTGPGHPESKDRYAVIQAALEQYPFASPAKFYEAPIITKEALTSVHDENYVDWIISIAPKKKIINIDEDTRMGPDTLPAALRAAGAVAFAVDLVMQDEAKVVFCNVRPPGHHAEREKAMGFCFFNNVAIGVKRAMQHYGLKRVAVIDFDVHHGNGTHQLFQGEKGVLLCSSFQHPIFPGFDDESEFHHVLPVMLRAGMGGKEYRELVSKAWFEKLDAFKPELIFFSAGFDAHKDDPLAELNLEAADYVWLTKQIAAIADKHCHGKMISVLEGGYNLDVLATCVPAHVNAMVEKR